MEEAITRLEQLVTLRALEDGVPRATAWRQLFDPERLDADLDCEDPLRRRIAERALGALAVMLLRREVANATTSRVRLFELASLARQAANEEISSVVGDSGLDVDPN